MLLHKLPHVLQDHSLYFFRDEFLPHALMGHGYLQLCILVYYFVSESLDVMLHLLVGKDAAEEPLGLIYGIGRIAALNVVGILTN